MARAFDQAASPDSIALPVKEETDGSLLCSVVCDIQLGDGLVWPDAEVARYHQ